MKRNTRKGFTGIELVIVIAIIAILASALIPTFSGLINSANATADKQAVREMNTALMVDGIRKPTTPGKLFDVLGDAGLDAEDYKPLSKGKYFYWDRELNQVLYVDSDRTTVLFPENVTPSGQWYCLDGSFDTKNVTIEPTLSDDTVKFTISNGAEFVKAAEYVNSHASEYANKTLQIVLDGDIDLQGADICFTEEATSNMNVVITSIDDNVRTIKHLYISDKHATFGADSDSNVSKTYGHSLFNHIKDLTVTNINVEYSVIAGYEASQGGFFAGQVNGTAEFANVTVQNCDVQASRKVGVLCGYTHGAIKFSNVTIDSCSVTSAQGEAGIVFGVMEVSGISKDEYVVDGDITVTKSTVSVADFATVTTYKVDDQEYKIVEYTENNTLKGRVATANFAFYSISNSPEKTTIGSVKVAAYPALDTAEEFFAAKGVK